MASSGGSMPHAFVRDVPEHCRPRQATCDVIDRATRFRRWLHYVANHSATAAQSFGLNVMVKLAGALPFSSRGRGSERSTARNTALSQAEFPLDLLSRADSSEPSGASVTDTTAAGLPDTSSVNTMFGFTRRRTRSA